MFVVMRLEVKIFTTGHQNGKTQNGETQDND
jgi:hypothetical protein